MKQLYYTLLLALLFITCEHCQAQVEYFPHGTMWVQGYNDTFTGETTLYREFYVDGTMNKNGVEYKKVKCHYLEGGESDSYNLFREEGSRIFVYFEEIEIDRETLYYDFDWTEGKDVALLFYDEKDYAKATDVHREVLNDGNEYEYIKKGIDYYIINTIGKMMGYDGPFGRGNEVDNGRNYFIAKFVRNDVVVYENSDVTGILAMKNNVFQTPTPLYDLSGRRLSKEPQKGVYIRDGKKVVIK